MSLILTLSCQDRPGIVAAVSGFLATHRFNIRESAQFGDGETGLFFMRVSVEDLEAGPDGSGRLWSRSAPPSRPLRRPST